MLASRKSQIVARRYSCPEPLPSNAVGTLSATDMVENIQRYVSGSQSDSVVLRWPKESLEAALH